LHAAELAARAPHGSFLQVSTCFVAGNREGRILEEALPNYTANGLPLDVDAEQALLKQLVIDTHESVMGERAIAELRAEITKSVAEKGHDPNNHQLIERIMRREEKARLTEGLVEAGKARAKHYGFPNVYTFTKSLAESALLARFPKLDKSFFRPAIVESAVSFPMPGWNEGLNTSGPLVYFTGTWFRHLPARKDKPLDVVPVDYCCAGIMAVAAALVSGCAKPAYQCATSDRHPLTVGRGLELTSLAHRRYYRAHGEDAVERVVLSRWDNKVVADDHPINVDNMRSLVQWLSDALKDVPQGLPERLRKEEAGREERPPRPQAQRRGKGDRHVQAVRVRQPPDVRVRRAGRAEARRAVLPLRARKARLAPLLDRSARAGPPALVVPDHREHEGGAVRPEGAGQAARSARRAAARRPR